MLRLLIVLWLAVGAPAAVLAQPQPQAPAADVWARTDGRITFTTARISFPERPGATSFRQSGEFSRRGEGLDNALQYHSDDREVFATVYVYYPGLPHAGLTAFATDNAIQTQSGSDLRALGSRSVAAAGRPNMAIRSDYLGFRSERLASSAAFIKAGRWIVKFRVSGPESRRDDVDRTMNALLDGVRFEGEIVPIDPAMLQVTDCQGAAGPPARIMPRDGADALADALIGVFDGADFDAVNEQGGRADLVPRFQTHWCVSERARIGSSVIPILRAGSASERSIVGRSVLAGVVNDAGTILEIVELDEPARFILLAHQIGATEILAAFASIPTNEQIIAILSGADREGGRIRARVQLKANGDTDLQIQSIQPPAEDRPAS